MLSAYIRLRLADYLREKGNRTSKAFDTNSAGGEGKLIGNYLERGRASRTDALQATWLIVIEPGLAFELHFWRLRHSAVPRMFAARRRWRRQGALGEDRGWHYTTTISGSRRAAERAIVVGRYWRALNPNTVCRRALPVAPSYLRRPPTLPHKRPVVEQLHCGIPIVHVSAACMQRRIRPFMRSLAHPIPTYIPTPVARPSLRGEWPSPITIP